MHSFGEIPYQQSITSCRKILNTREVNNLSALPTRDLELRPVPVARARVLAAVDGKLRCTAIDTERGGRADEVDVGEDDASTRCAERVWVRLVDEDTKLAEAASGVPLIYWRIIQIGQLHVVSQRNRLNNGCNEMR